MAGGDEIHLSVLATNDFGSRKNLPIPIRSHHPATISRVLACEIRRVASTDNAHRRITTEHPGRKGDRSANRLEITRRQGNQKAFNLSSETLLEMPSHRF